MTEVVALLVDTLERARFMDRVARSLAGEARFLFITTEPLAAISLRSSGTVIYLSALMGHRRGASADDRALARRSIEVLNNEVSEQTGARDIAAICAELHRVFKESDVTRCLIWNGQQLLGRAAAQVSRDLGVTTRFIEIANLPNRMFSDPRGVNSEASFCVDRTLIDDLEDVPHAEHLEWLTEYETAKAARLPQSRTRVRRRLLSAINHVLKAATGGRARRRISRLGVSRGGAVRLWERYSFGDAELPPEFVFMPLQITGDTQLKLHSDFDNISAIDKALQIAAGLMLPLVVKLHPAETNINTVRTLINRNFDRKFIASNRSTPYLLHKASHIVTVNSTVGLEALLYGKQVTILGRALYSDFGEDRVRKYVHRILVTGIDYFGSDDIEPVAARRLIGLESSAK